MARQKKEDVKPGSPAWMATFSDLMNLLLCFFVLLFSMSTVDLEKFELVINSIQSSFSILPQGGATIGEGQMVGAGISQLENLDIFYKEANSPSQEKSESEETSDFEEQYEAAALAESEEMGEKIEDLLAQYGIADKVQVDINGQFVRLTLNGALLFNSGEAQIREEALPLVDKLGQIVTSYGENLIDIEGHTDNVPVPAGVKFENNDVLSSYRAHAVKDYFMDNTLLSPANVRATGCGEYNPVADNTTAEGRALNRRVEIKIYNSLSSY